MDKLAFVPRATGLSAMIVAGVKERAGVLGVGAFGPGGGIPRRGKEGALSGTRVSCEDTYGRMTVPSRRRVVPQRKSKGVAVGNGNLAASFSSTSIPRPGESLAYIEPSLISGQPGK